jgi:chromosome partitioning protein
MAIVAMWLSWPQQKKNFLHKEVRPMEQLDLPTRVVAFGNQKGGVTKTSTVVNLAAALSERGKRVLVFDLDVNCGSTRLFGVPQGVNVYGTYEVMLGDELPLEVVIRPGDMDTVNLPKNVHLIAAHTKLEGIEAALAAKQGPFASSHDSLRVPIASLKGQYDYVFLDTSPSMTPPTKAAYMVAQHFVLTAVPERLAIEGLVNAIQYIKHARNSGNPGLRLMGVVMNQVPGRATRLSTALMEEVDRHFSAGDEFMRRFQSSISASTIVPAVQQGGKTLFEEAPDHKVTQQYRDLAEEFEKRFERLAETQSPGASPVEAFVNSGVVARRAGRAGGVVNG